MVIYTNEDECLLHLGSVSPLADKLPDSRICQTSNIFWFHRSRIAISDRYTFDTCI